MPARRVPGPRGLLRQFRRQPRLWLALFAWPLLVLGLVLARHLLLPSTGRTVALCEALLLASAIVALAWGIGLARGLYRGLRALRKLLFDGNYESALDLVRRHPALAEGIGLESALELLLAFDRRRAERVAAATRLFDRLMREVPLPILVGILDDDVVRFSRALSRILDVSDDQFPLDSLLLPAANRHFAYVWDQLATGRKGAVSTTVALQLPIANATVPLRLRLLAVQNDQGKIAYILGLAEPPKPKAPPADGILTGEGSALVQSDAPPDEAAEEA